MKVDSSETVTKHLLCSGLLYIQGNVIIDLNPTKYAFLKKRGTIYEKKVWL